jgi:hypothetical protein
MAITQNRSALESLQSFRGEYAQDYRAASLAAKLADTCVSASFRPALWLLYYERFYGVVSTEPTDRKHHDLGTA